MIIEAGLEIKSDNVKPYNPAMKHLLPLLFLLFIQIATAQIKFEGIVKDSIGNVLELANVIAINQESQALESFAITDEKGYFLLSLKKNTKYDLQVSYIGMKSFEDLISTTDQDIKKEFILEPDNTLDTVELTYEMPVTVQGDTLVYNADSFNTGTERKLEDVLEMRLHQGILCFVLENFI